MMKNFKYACQSGGFEEKISTYGLRTELTNGSEPTKTTFTEGGVWVWVLQNFCILATRQVSVALTSAGPAVQMTRWVFSANLAAKWAPWRSFVLANMSWEGKWSVSLGKSRDNCSRRTLRGYTRKKMLLEQAETSWNKLGTLKNDKFTMELSVEDARLLPPLLLLFEGIGVAEVDDIVEEATKEDGAGIPAIFCCFNANGPIGLSRLLENNRDFLSLPKF